MSKTNRIKNNKMLVHGTKCFLRSSTYLFIATLMNQCDRHTSFERGLQN